MIAGHARREMYKTCIMLVNEQKSTPVKERAVKGKTALQVPPFARHLAAKNNPGAQLPWSYDDTNKSKHSPACHTPQSTRVRVLFNTRALDAPAQVKIIRVCFFSISVFSGSWPYPVVLKKTTQKPIKNRPSGKAGQSNPAGSLSLQSVTYMATQRNAGRPPFLSTLPPPSLASSSACSAL